jgi:hypothetical protein
LSAAGSCFGFGVHASVPLHYLRTGSGPRLTVTVGSTVVEPDGTPIMEWRRTANNPFEARLFEFGDSFRLWVAGTGWFVVDPAGSRIEMPEAGDDVRREERLWGVPAQLCLLARGDLPIHAAAVEVDGGAIILGAPGGWGKTTLAAAFLNAGHRLLSEDVTCVRPGDPPQVVPGPAMLRVRPDVAERLEIPGASIISESDGRVHLAVNAELRGDCRPVPLRAAFLLRDATTAGIRPVAPTEALRDLWALSSMLPTTRGLGRAFEELADVVARIPVWNLDRRATIDALPETIRLVVDALDTGR